MTGRAIGRRHFLTSLSASVAASALFSTNTVFAQQTEAASAPEFSFDGLTERMRLHSKEPYRKPQPVEGFVADLDYDGYQMIRYRRDRTRWEEEGQIFGLQAFHLGWLFEEPVAIHEVVEGREVTLGFSTADFEYGKGITQDIPENAPMPGVAGFRLLSPLNRVNRFDELIAFLGASYFRALGHANVYGLSARGLAVNTGHSEGEEFPRFSEFWLERPALGADAVVVYAALNSPSVTGAYRFVIRPGDTTVVDVTARLFLRKDIAQLGIAPITSMFLFGGSDPDEQDDFRAAVHDSEALILNTRNDETFYRPLNNPPRLSNSYFGAQNPSSFGLVQRSRRFDDYLDAEAHYEKRPSLMVEPLGDWGSGTMRLVEIPSQLEGNDNIVAFWVPEGDMRAGRELEVTYRLHWGMNPPGDAHAARARILRTRVGEGGVAGVEEKNGRRKFVVDFAGGFLRELSGDADVIPQVSATKGTVTQVVLSQISGTQTWRLVIEVEAAAGAVVELKASLSGYGRVLSETWLYQWMRK
ncbi:glucan biosynthesis protein [Pseudorhodobacter aquimaris]|uniref:glucan biosynthesis protein n=1 Tax=Pseudorhodobacter aquimaris TaxID=687412 RepID=UPI0009F81F75|nr:glucan biosynthesis protein G [Pseudorhodobacter aquimaris]